MMATLALNGLSFQKEYFTCISKGSILKSRLFNTFICNLFFMLNKQDFFSCTDDNTLYIAEDGAKQDLEYLKNTLRRVASLVC